MASKLTHIKDLINDYNLRDKNVCKQSIPTGFPDLDRNIQGGLQPGSLNVIAARPGMGKSSFTNNIAESVAERTKKSVVIFSLENSGEQICMNILASYSFISKNTILTGDFDECEDKRFKKASQKLSQSPIYINDNSSISISEIRETLESVQNLGLIIIDYIQLMYTENKYDESENEILKNIQNLSLFAKELDVPVIVVSQLSRKLEYRINKRPRLSDLHYHGAMEQYADVILFLYRDDYYYEDENPGIAECIIAKNRYGERCVIELHWHSDYMRFCTLERRHHIEEQENE